MPVFKKEKTGVEPVFQLFNESMTPSGP
jgi:hypothetical protein